MTDEVEGLVSSINLNQILIMLLEEHGKLAVPTMRFIDLKTEDKELVIDYDEDGPSFIFSVREKNGEQ